MASAASPTLPSGFIGAVWMFNVSTMRLSVSFWTQHLPSCRCIGVVQRHRRSLSAALGHLLVVLRSEGVIARPVVSNTPTDDELHRYSEYMERVRGLAPKTQASALRIVRRFLISRFGDYAIDVIAIKPEHVRRFFAQEAKLYSKPVTAGMVVASLRGYFRYRASLGDLVHGLIGVLSYPANWQLSSLPKTLTTEEVERLVESLGHATPPNDGVSPSYGAPSILAFAAVRSPDSVSTISTGGPAPSPCATPRGAGKTCCRCRPPLVRPSPRT